MRIRYDRLPEHMREPARAYVEEHQPVGGFLRAVLQNDLVNAFGRADADNRDAMREWALWLWNDIPQACWGSKEKVDAWLATVPATGLRCPDWPGDGDAVTGCGGTNIKWDGEVWDCLDCGLYFTTEAGTPPAGTEEDGDE